MTNEAMFKEITNRMLEIYKTKNNDYGSSVSDTYKKFGIDSYLVRIYDKINRVYTLTRTQAEAKVNDEKIEDTLLDLANYSILALIELKAEQNKPSSLDKFMIDHKSLRGGDADV